MTCLGVAIEVETTVGAVLTALGLEVVPPGCELTTDSVIELEAFADEDDLTTVADAAYTLEEHLDQTAVMELAAAIRRGDMAEAELLLERIFGAELTVKEWVQRGSCSCRAAA